MYITRGSVVVALVKKNTFYILAYLEETTLSGLNKGDRVEITPLGSSRIMHGTADHAVSAKNEVKRAYHFHRLLSEMNEYQQKRVDDQAPLGVTVPNKLLADLLHRYRHALID